MTDPTLERELQELDRDGAIQENMYELERACGFHDDPTVDPLAVETDTVSRSALLRRGAVGAGALAGGAALFGVAAPAFGQRRSAAQDRAILNYALTLEYLEAAFYADAIAKGALRGETLRFARITGQHENIHVTFLRGVLGRRAVRRPRFDFKGTTSNAATFRQTALVLEDTGVRAYGGQVTRIQSKQILTAAAQVHAVEARHAAWIADILGRNPAPAALNPVSSMAQILAAVRKTGFIRR